MVEFTPTILVVEDQPNVRDLFDKVFSLDGCRILHAEDVSSSKGLIDAEPIHLAVVDYWLPDGHGSEVIEYLRRVRPGAQSIVVTALGPDRRVDEMIKNGAFAYVKKPFDVDAFRAQARRALMLCRLAHENQALQSHMESFNDELRARDRELGAIRRLARLTDEDEDFESRGEKALSIVFDLLEGDAVLAYFAVAPAERRHLLLRHHFGLTAEEQEALSRLRLDEGLVGKANLERELVVSEDLGALPVGLGGPGGPPAALGRARWALALPVSSKGQLVGMLVGGCLSEEACRRAERLMRDSVGRFFIVAMENVHLSEAATVDSLTALYNRGYFDARLDQEVSRAERYGSRLALCLADLDGFKELNDTYGHLFGDKVLREVCRFWKQGLRKSDFAARYGGDELALVLPEAGVEGARRVAEKIRAAIEGLKLGSPNGRPTPHLGVTVSIGIACFPEQASSVEEFLRAADRALYRAKGRGGNRVVCFDGAAGGP